MGFHPAKFGLPIGLSVLELCRGTPQTYGRTDGQTTDATGAGT